MADTVRTLSALQTLLADNTSGNISPQDVRDFLVSVHSPVAGLTYKGTADDPPDDEFDDTTGMSGATNGLDAKWTAVNGSEAAVDLLEAGNVSRYDLDTRPGWLLMQAGNDGLQAVDLRQDWTLGDGESVVCAVAPTGSWDDDLSTIANNEVRVGIHLNSTDSGNDAGDDFGVLLDTNAGEMSIKCFSDISGFTGLGEVPYYGARITYLRIARSSLTYYGFASYDGATWLPLGSRGSYSAALDNLWIYCQNSASAGDPVPISGFYWVRKGTNAIDFGW